MFLLFLSFACFYEVALERTSHIDRYVPLAMFGNDLVLDYRVNGSLLRKNLPAYKYSWFDIVSDEKYYGYFSIYSSYFDTTCISAYADTLFESVDCDVMPNCYAIRKKNLIHKWYGSNVYLCMGNRKGITVESRNYSITSVNVGYRSVQEYYQRYGVFLSFDVQDQEGYDVYKLGDQFGNSLGFVYLPYYVVEFYSKRDLFDSIQTFPSWHDVRVMIPDTSHLSHLFQPVPPHLIHLPLMVKLPEDHYFTFYCVDHLSECPRRKENCYLRTGCRYYLPYNDTHRICWDILRPQSIDKCPTIFKPTTFFHDNIVNVPVRTHKYHWYNFIIDALEQFVIKVFSLVLEPFLEFVVEFVNRSEPVLAKIFSIFSKLVLQLLKDLTHAFVTWFESTITTYEDVLLLMVSLLVKLFDMIHLFVIKLDNGLFLFEYLILYLILLRHYSRVFSFFLWLLILIVIGPVRRWPSILNVLNFYLNDTFTLLLNNLTSDDIFLKSNIRYVPGTAISLYTNLTGT